MTRHLSPASAALAVLFALSSAAGGEEEEKKLGWLDTAELTYVATGGNAEAETLGLRNTLFRVWKVGVLKLETGALRAETTTTSRRAIGSRQDFLVQEESDTRLTAETYFLRGRYDRPINEKLFWFAGAGWERNQFAGLENRLSAVAGVGHSWLDDGASHFRTDYGFSFTDQEDVVDDPSRDDAFLGLRLGWDYLRQLTGTAFLGSLLLVDQNIDESDDLRADMTNSITVTMSNRLALKVSLQVLFDNQPGLVGVPLFTADDSPTGLVVLGELEEIDTILNVALVAHF